MRHDRILTPLILLLAFSSHSNASTPQEEWEFLREAAKEVELYLPNEALVNAEDQKVDQDTEIIDEISTGQAALKRSDGVKLRQRSLEERPDEVLPTPHPTTGNSRSPALPGRRFRGR